MPRSGLAVPRDQSATRRTSHVRTGFEPDGLESRSDSYRFEAERMRRRAELRRAQAQIRPRTASPAASEVIEPPARRTVTITGHGAEAYASRNGTRASTAQRHRQLKPHEREGFRPDRVAMWAFLLGVLMILVAAASSHAAVLHGLPLH